MQLRYLPIIALFIHFSALSQFKEEWKDLPRVEGSKAFISTQSVKTSDYTKKSEPSTISETFSGGEIEFITHIVPEELKDFKFIEHDLAWDQTMGVSNGLIFKDLSTSNIRYLDMAHGLVGNSVTAIAEGSNGVIYLGLSNALVKYNGSELVVFKSSPAFSFDGIRSLFFDTKERLWVATDVGICYIYEGRLFVPESRVFGTTHLKGFNESPETGELFIFTRFNGLFIVKEGKIHQYKNGLPNTSVSIAMRSTDGKLWITTSGVGFIENDSLFLYGKEGNTDTPTALLELDNEIWIGFFRGSLMKYARDSLFHVTIDAHDKHSIYSMESTEKGIWMTDYGRGVYLIKNNDEVVSFNKTIGMCGRTAFSLLIDRFDNVWVADTYHGISRIDENVIYKSSKSIVQGSVTDIEIDDRGNTWYFVSGGLLTSENIDGNIRTYSGNGTYCGDGLIVNDEVWMSGADKGLGRLSKNVFTFYSMKETVESDSTLYSIQMDQGGGIWGWNFANKLYYFKDETFYDYTSAAAWKDFEVLSVMQTRSKTIFALTRNDGVIAIRNGKYQLINDKNGLASNRVSTIFEDTSGHFWYGLNDQVQIVDSLGNSVFLSFPELQNNPVSDILQDSINSFLATTPNGILSIVREGTDYRYKFYGKEHGLNLVGNSLIKRDANGNILIGGRGNLMTYDPYFLKTGISPPTLSLNRILVGDTSIVQQESTIRTDQETPITFVFNNIFWGGSSILYYRLDYRNSTSNRTKASLNSITFDELNYGDYMLTVFAEGDGQRSHELNFSFTVLPYWYQTSWSKVLFVVVGVVIIVAIFLYRERNARHVKRKLEEMVDEKTMLLQAEKQEVSKQLNQKEILMQEVHHRVKNNLTFLKSLLYLRASASEDKDVKLILDECQARIHSMALVHQNLYDVEDASEVDFNLFLKELFFELESMFDQDRTNIKIDLAVSDFKIDMKLSVFLGLILNEMITNSFKYAFPNGENGQIRVCLSQVSEKFELSYSDSGRGFPDGFDFKASTGFGFKLINILLNQINAQMQYVNNGTSTFTILIPK